MNDHHTNQHEIKVTYLGNNKWGCRCFLNGKLVDESVVEQRIDIGNACRQLLRWQSKMGSSSHYSDRARHRIGEKQYGVKPK